MSGNSSHLQNSRTPLVDPTAHSPHVLIGESASASPSASPPPKKTSAKWQNAAMKANPKLDSDKLARAADISSKRLSKVKIQDSSSVSLMEIANNLHGLMYPPEKVFKGGEGVARIVRARENDHCRTPYLKLEDKYWTTTLFAWRGRALPMAPWLLYLGYVLVVVLSVHYRWPNYANVSELKGLTLPLSTMGTALFLLMSFRTNSCYDRWWEGRKLWDAITHKCLDMGRVAEAWVAPKSPAAASELVRVTIAYSVIVKKYLRQDWKVLDELHGILPKAVVDKLETDYNPILGISVMLTKAIEPIGPLVPAPVLAGLENQIRAMIADALACNRIYYTPMPFAYIVHLRSFMVLWLFMLPFAFMPTMGLLSIFICAIVSYQLLGFEDIGVEIESPFGHDYNDLPVDNLQAQIFNNMIKCLSNINAEVTSR